jgi:hypothetical protein
MRQFLILFLIITTLFSCKQDKKTDTSSIKIEGVSLDNTKLWQANIETTEGIKTMQKIMHSFSKEDDVTAYALLKDKLEIEFTNIFQKCTMKGKSHEQLHNYLKPMIGMFKDLESSDLETCKTSFKTLENHLAGYANYFK